MPGESEVHGLVALMELQASRLKARVDAAGAPVRLEEQNRARWDRRAHPPRPGGHRPGARPRRRRRAAYLLQAEIAACHALAPTVQATDWRRIAVALRRRWPAVWPSPVVALNRAVAVAMAEGPAAGLAMVEALRDEPALRDYHLLPAVRADLLLRLDRRERSPRRVRARRRDDRQRPRARPAARPRQRELTLDQRLATSG